MQFFKNLIKILSNNQIIRIMWAIITLILFIYFIINAINAIWVVILPIIIAGFLIIFAAPIMLFLKKRKFNNIISSIFAVIAIIIILIICSYAFFVVLYHQVIQFFEMGSNLLIYLKNYELTPELISNFLNNYNLGFINDLFSKLNTLIIDFLERFNWDNIFNEISNNLEMYALQIKKLLSNLLLTIYVFLVSPILAIYILIERHKIKENIQYLVKPKYRKEFKNTLQEISQKFNSYVIGMGKIMLIMGSLTFIGLLILGVDDALPLAIISAFLNFIPYIGVFLSLILALIVAILDDPSKIVFILILYIALQQIEIYLIAPNVMSKSVNVSALGVIITCLLFGFIFGIIGLIIATPLLIIITITYRRLKKNSKWFKEI